MTDRERLIKVIKESVNVTGEDAIWESACEKIADNLIAKGVEVPRVLVGDTVYAVAAITHRIISGEVVRVSEDTYGMTTNVGGKTLTGNWFKSKDVGRSILTTREEAIELARSMENENTKIHLLYSNRMEAKE